MIIDSKRMVIPYAGICALLIAVFWCTAVWAQQVTSDAPAHASAEVTVDQDIKVWALKRAYQINGNSMVGFGTSIDLSDEVKNLTHPEEFNVLDAAAVPVPEVAPAGDACAKHSRRGKCRK